jgi:hypothetical protein
MDPSRVSELLFGGGEAVDSEVLEYLLSLAPDEDDDEEERVAQVQEVCAGASPAFAALPSNEQTRRVLAFLAESSRGGNGAGASTLTPNPTDAAAAAAAAAAALAAALANLGAGQRTAGEHEDDVGAGHRSSSGGGGSGDSDNADAAAVDGLADLIPDDACAGGRAEARRFARFVLRERFGGDPDAAADWLLAQAGEATTSTTARLSAAIAQWRRAAEQREEEQKQEASARDRDRQATLARFAWSGGGGSKPEKPAQVQAPRVRFLDGVPVTTKGDKYVVVSQKEEWDGGSRGRVKTKGKRGSGWA